MTTRWGRWQCPYEGCENTPDDPDFPRVTCCGLDGHSVLLGPIEDSGWRWAEKYQPTDADVALAVIEAKIYNRTRQTQGGQSK